MNVKKFGSVYKPINKNQFSLTKLVYLLKSVIKEENKNGARYGGHECPQAVYSKQRIRTFTDCHFEGYSQYYIQIDLDFVAV